MDDDARMMEAMAGDTQAFGHIVAAYQSRLLRFAQRVLGDAETAQDAVQEAFLRIWRSRQSYRSQGNPSSYLYRVVHNVCMDLHRCEKAGLTRNEHFRVAESDSLERKIQTRALSDAARCVIEELPKAQRAVFILSHYEGLSYSQIAEILGCPVNTVASRKNQAVATLRRRLRHWIEESET